LDTLGEMVVPDHIGRLQVLMRDHVVLTHQRERRLVVKVLPLAPDLLVRLGQQYDRLAPAIAPFLAP
jgi:hypothetical protein